jgi:hypothetical protein
VEFLLNPKADVGKLHSALVCLVDGNIEYLDFAELLDPKTGKSRIRGVDMGTPSYKVAREYMIRLEREDFEDEERLRLLAQAASSKTTPITPDEFKTRFQHLTALRGGI